VVTENRARQIAGTTIMGNFPDLPMLEVEVKDHPRIPLACPSSAGIKS
jgi:hypothetical protein